jgi:hypothetical protein
MLYYFLFLLFIVITGYTIYTFYNKKNKEENKKVDKKKIGIILLVSTGIAALIFFLPRMTFKKGEITIEAAPTNKELFNKIEQAFSKTTDIFPENNAPIIIPSKSARLF